MRKHISLLLIFAISLPASAAVMKETAQKKSASDKESKQQINNSARSKVEHSLKKDKLRQSVEVEQFALKLMNKQSVSNIQWPKLERDFYAKLLELQMGRQWTDFLNGSAVFLRRHPNSTFADNVLFLRGMAYVGLSKYGEAIQDFNRVEKLYPTSNKAVSSIFAKGAAYNKLGVRESAKEVFEKIVKQYPGSRESFRAQTELRILNQSSAKKKLDENKVVR